METDVSSSWTGQFFVYFACLLGSKPQNSSGVKFDDWKSKNTEDTIKVMMLIVGGSTQVWTILEFQASKNWLYEKGGKAHKKNCPIEKSLGFSVSAPTGLRAPFQREKHTAE